MYFTVTDDTIQNHDFSKPLVAIILSPRWNDLIAKRNIAKSIKKAEIITYEDLGAEALRKLEVVDFPAIVINDIYGGDLYQEGQEQWNELDK